MARQTFDIDPEAARMSVRPGGRALRGCIAFIAAYFALTGGAAAADAPATPAGADVPAPTATANVPAAAGSAAARHARRHASGTTLDDRVRLLAKELDLDAVQQVEVKSILQTQRVEVAKVASDPSVPAPVRVGAMQAIGDRTADRIRAILTDEQRKKYIKPRQHEAPVDVQKWMQSAQDAERARTTAAAPAAAKGN